MEHKKTCACLLTPSQPIRATVARAETPAELWVVLSILPAAPGLEPEIQKLITKHRQDIQKLKMLHEAELLQSDERAAQRYCRQAEELRGLLEQQKEEQSQRERELARQRYVGLVASSTQPQWVPGAVSSGACGAAPGGGIWASSRDVLDGIQGRVEGKPCSSVLGAQMP